MKRPTNPLVLVRERLSTELDLCIQSLKFRSAQGGQLQRKEGYYSGLLCALRILDSVQNLNSKEGTKK